MITKGPVDEIIGTIHNPKWYSRETIKDVTKFYTIKDINKKITNEGLTVLSNRVKIGDEIFIYYCVKEWMIYLE